MKRFVMAVAFTGLMSLTALAGNIPTNDFVTPPPPTSQSTTSNTSLSVTLADVVLTIIILIER